MKTAIHFCCCLIATFTLMTSFSCERDEDTTTIETQALTDDEIVAIVSGALQADSEGLVAETTDMAATADALDDKSVTGLSCGETRDTTTSRSLDEPNITADYTSTLTATLSCNENGFPAALGYQRSSNGAYETARMLSQDDVNSDLVLTELLRGPNYVLNGSYLRQGEQTSKVREERVFKSTLSMAVEEVLIDKGDRRINGGEATIELTVAINDTARSTRTMQLIFAGNGTASLIINGNVYTISL